MANIINRHDADLALPMGGPVLRPGVAASVTNWVTMKDHAMVKSWLAAGLLEVEETAADAVTLEPANATQEVAIPDDWQDLSWNERRSLAAQLSSEPVRNGDEANAVIEREIERRKG
jgi:hypothetical protein